MTLAAQSKKVSARLNAIPSEVLAELRPALMAGGEEIAGAMRALAEGSRDSGDLIASITVTGPGETTPAYAAGGGRRTAAANQVLVTVGNPDVRHGHFVEFGTVKAEAQPYMRPGFRMVRSRVLGRISRAIGKAIKKVGQGNA